MKILLIKLGAMGDVLRTTPLLSALRRRHPAAHITWLVDTAFRDVLERNAMIDRLLTLETATLAELKKDHFDLSINLEKDAEALNAVMSIPAKEKLGFGLDAEGKLCALNSLSDYAYRLGIDDDLKFRKNTKSYQQISFEQVGLHFHNEDYVFQPDPESAQIARRKLKEMGVEPRFHDGILIGLNTGSGPRFAGKKLPIATYVDLIKRFRQDMNASVMLLGGKDEAERNQLIADSSPYPVINSGYHPIKEFACFVQECDLIITGDTTAMHIAIAMKTPLVVFFGSTCAAEIELYGRGKKIISPLPCAPCYLRDCPIDEQCMQDITADMIYKAAKEVLQVQHK